MNAMANNSKKNTIITVTVNLDKVRDGDKCKKFTTFSDNRGNLDKEPDVIDSPVNRGKRIFWIGNLEGSLNEDDFIDILIVSKKNANQKSLLKKDFYLGENGIVKGKIRKDIELVEAIENEANQEDGLIKMNYSIAFLVGYKETASENDNMHYKICSIDPKIRMA